MRITEKELRRIIREMALKGINIARAQQMDDTTGRQYYNSPDESGVFPKLSSPDFVPQVSAEDMYQATVRTWDRDSYKTYAARQFERFPVGLNVFLVPGAKGEAIDLLGGVSRFTRPDDPVANAEGLRIIRQHFPGAQIDDDDFNILLLTRRAHLIGASGLKKDDIVPPPRVFLNTEGVYNTFHALFDNGILQRERLAMSNQVDGVCAIVAGLKVIKYDYQAFKKLLSIGQESPLNGVFRLRTLRMKKVQDTSELRHELFTVSLIRQTVPVRPDEFPTHDMNGAEIPDDRRQMGINLVREMIPFLEDARDSWRELAGKTIIGSSTPTT